MDVDDVGAPTDVGEDAIGWPMFIDAADVGLPADIAKQGEAVKILMQLMLLGAGAAGW